MPVTPTDNPYGRAFERTCDCPADVETDETVFVSPEGADDAAGTPAAPVLTLSRAIRLAAERGHTIYVCP